MARGLLRHVRWLLRLRRFPVPEELAVMLAPAGLTEVDRRRVSGLGGQVSVLAIGRRI